MIQSGRRKKETQVYTGTPVIRKSARFVTILGILVFTVFLCSSVNSYSLDAQALNDFGEGAYPVFAPVSGNPDTDLKDTALMEDTSIWAYLESVIARLIYGDP